MRTARPVLPAALAAVAATVAVTVCPLLPAPPAHADRTTLPATLDTRTQDTATLSVPVPEGVRPRWVTGVLRVEDAEVDPDDADGTVLLRVDGRTAEEVPAVAWQRVAVPVGPEDVREDGTISLGVRHRPDDPGDGCRPLEPAVATLRKLGLVHGGAETVRSDPARFFPAAASRVDVVVPRRASDDVLSAALAAVAALSSRYPAEVPVELWTPDVVLPRAGAGQRVVRLSPGPGPVGRRTEIRFGLPTLTLTGAGEELRAAAAALGAGLPTTAPEAPPAARRTLADLGAGRVALSGYGRSATHVEVHQDSFGGAVRSLDVTLTGTHTTVPAGTVARLDTYLDDRLVDSRVLAEGPRFQVETTVPGSRTTATTRLELVLTAVPADGCTATLPPLEVELDTDDSVLVAEPADRAPAGFARFPQVLGGRLPVAVRGQGAVRTVAATHAARLVSALQRAAAYPLDVELVPPTELLDGTLSGLIVGAGWTDAVTLGTRLRPDPEGERGAALQAATDGERHALVLGALGGERTGRLLRGLAQQTARDGWSSLSGDVVVTDGGQGTPYVEGQAGPGEPAPQPVAAPSGAGTSWVPWLLATGAGLALVAAGAAARLRGRRPRPVAARGRLSGLVRRP